MTLSATLFGTGTRASYVRGTARSRPPHETLAHLLPALPRYGITRLSNITGLDRIGIPVYQAIRPNARSLSLSQGKGVDRDSAKVSALMEALECHHAEHASCPVRIESYRALAERGRVAEPARLPLAKISEFTPDRQLPWAEARSVRTNEPVFVPFELVHANATLPRLAGSGCFVFSTNGLASGNNLVEAVLHGSAELIERDAEALFHLASPERQQARRIDLASVDHDSALELLARFANAGVELAVWDMTSDVGVPTFRVLLFDPESDAELNPYPAAYGAGCHPERGIALCRALTEAAQTRLTSIAGARDDLLRERYAELGRSELGAHFRALLNERGSRRFSDAPTFTAPTLDAELEFLVSKLEARGINDVLVVDLSTPDLDVAFARVVIPGLEGPVQSPSYAPGARARAAGASP